MLTLWTLPNYLTEWEIRRIKSIGRAVIPEAMQSWSEPLPAEQWAKPSEKLKRMTQAVKTLHEQKPNQNLAARFTEAVELTSSARQR